jgi:hypothetical protein
LFLLFNLKQNIEVINDQKKRTKLINQKKITGTCRVAAKLRAACASPSLAVPSPK